jgi:hypothetical protein
MGREERERVYNQGGEVSTKAESKPANTRCLGTQETGTRYTDTHTEYTDIQ